METWSFLSDNDYLVSLVLEGKKTATTSLYKEYEMKNEELPKVGDESILLFCNEKKACITRVKEVIITEFKNIDEKLSSLEGEGSLEHYRKVHYDLFSKIDKNFNDDSLVVFEIFEVKEDLTKKRIEYAKKIVDNNKDIFGDKKHIIKEINAGFNNDIFDVDNKYVLKVCVNESLESRFDNEVDFYNKNSSCNYIPKLYKYDKSKKIVNYVYEILEKIEGKSLYYYYYKMNESEREETIKEIVSILKSIHTYVKSDMDFASYVKGKVLEYFDITKKYFKEEDKEMILESISKYDKYLSDNKYSFIHNDLHFDNIIKNNNGLYLIDFNDACIMPFDYDLRILFMCKDTPWKWANIDMDPYQKKEDYQTICDYIKKYYKELSNVKYIDERMIIYRVLNDIELLTRYNNNELKENVVKYSKMLLENIELVIPKIEDYHYEEKIQSDPKTMNYNAGYDVSYFGYHYDTGCIDFPNSRWEEVYNKRLNPDRFFAYIKDKNINEFVGYVNYQYDSEEKRYTCGVLIEDKYRGKGYSKKALELLIEEARKNNIKELYDNFEESRVSALNLFTSLGFEIYEKTKWKKFGTYVDGVILRKVLK